MARTHRNSRVYALRELSMAMAASRKAMAASRKAMAEARKAKAYAESARTVLEMADAIMGFTIVLVKNGGITNTTTTGRVKYVHPEGDGYTLVCLAGELFFVFNNKVMSEEQRDLLVAGCTVTLTSHQGKVIAVAVTG